MSEQISALERKIDRILFHLEDDDKMNHKGLPSKVADHEKRIDKLEKGELANKAKVAGFSAGIGGLTGVVLSKLYTWLSHVLF